MNSVKKYIAEFIGTAVLVIMGCGTAMLVGCDTQGGYALTALAFGLVIVGMAYCVGNISGCHINPAVSLSMLMTKQMKVKEFAFYVISQILGAIAGAAILGFILGSYDKLGTNGFADGKLLVAFVTEVILTFIFITAILGVTSKKENGHTVGIVIGLTLVLVHLLGISITGTSVNPARSIGPAIFTRGDALSQLWVFIVAPIVGAILAALFYKFVIKERETTKFEFKITNRKLKTSDKVITAVPAVKEAAEVKPAKKVVKKAPAKKEVVKKETTKKAPAKKVVAKTKTTKKDK